MYTCVNDKQGGFWMAKTKVINIRLTNAERMLIKKSADKKKMTLSRFVIEAIKEYVRVMDFTK